MTNCFRWNENGYSGVMKEMGGLPTIFLKKKEAIIFYDKAG